MPIAEPSKQKECVNYICTTNLGIAKNHLPFGIDSSLAKPPRRLYSSVVSHELVFTDKCFAGGVSLNRGCAVPQQQQHKVKTYADALRSYPVILKNMFNYFNYISFSKKNLSL